MSDRPFCSVIIPAFNEEQNIETCLLSLTSQSYPRDKFEIIVVDNGSTDKTTEIASTYADLVLAKPEGNVGAVRNFGIANASGEIIICTDADCVVSHDWIEAGVTLLENFPRHAFGGGLRPREGASWVEKYWLLNDSGKSTQQRALMGSSIFMWQKHLVQLEGFNEAITSGEDTDLSERSTKSGLTVVVSAQLSVAHLGCPETPRDFIKRQIWHSENYVLDLKNSLRDKVFWLSLAYLGSLTSSLFTAFISNYALTLSLLVCTQVPATILSFKRITRSNWHLSSVAEIIKISLLDNFYLVGRSAGLVKGILKAISRPGGQPV